MSESVGCCGAVLRLGMLSVVSAIRFSPLLLLWSCTCGQPEALDACTSLDCMLNWAQSRWEKDPAEVGRQVLALQDPVQRTALVQALTEAYPGRTGDLCASLPRTVDQEQCLRANDRPHLWQVDDAEPQQGSMGAGKVYRNLVVATEDWPDGWDEVEPLVAPCDADRSETACQTEWALEQARHGRSLDAGRACVGIEQRKWRYECFFQAAEANRDGRGQFPPSVSAELCLGSGYFVYRCLGHLAEEMASQAPASGWDTPDTWRRIGGTTAEVHRVLQLRNPLLADRWLNRMWSDAMVVAYANAVTLAGNPLDAVEPRAVPHVRAILAWHLWQRGGHEYRSLESWAAAVEQTMLVRQIEPQVQPGQTQVQILPGQWIVDLPGEETIPWVAWPGDNRRALHTDPLLDATICMLEAAARKQTRYRPNMFREGLAHPDALVRWTAARLAGMFVPEVLQAGVDPAQETDPLVRARLALTREESADLCEPEASLPH